MLFGPSFTAFVCVYPHVSVGTMCQSPASGKGRYLPVGKLTFRGGAFHRRHWRPFDLLYPFSAAPQLQSFKVLTWFALIDVVG